MFHILILRSIMRKERMKGREALKDESRGREGGLNNGDIVCNVEAVARYGWALRCRSTLKTSAHTFSHSLP